MARPKEVKLLEDLQYEIAERQLQLVEQKLVLIDEQLDTERLRQEYLLRLKEKLEE